MYTFPVLQNMERKILVLVEYVNMAVLQWLFVKGCALFLKRKSNFDWRLYKFKAPHGEHTKSRLKTLNIVQ